MDRAGVDLLRDLLAPTGWVARARDFARSIRTAPHRAGGLLLVGTPTEEPWHLAAHLDDEARFAGLPEIAPTLLRWAPPAAAPPHLAVGLDRLDHAARGETLLVVAADAAPAPLLERLSDARHAGATVLAMDRGDRDLEALAHDALVLSRADEGSAARLTFDAVQHLVSVAAGEELPRRSGRSSVRARLAGWLDTVSGPSPRR